LMNFEQHEDGGTGQVASPVSPKAKVNPILGSMLG
jgi:hypothetical protein